jgi:hypothetical protein
VKLTANTSKVPLPSSLPLRLFELRWSYIRRLLLALIFVAPFIDPSEAVEPGADAGSRITATADIKMQPATPVSVQNIVKGYRSGVRESLQIVVRSHAEWLTLWRRHSSDLNASPPAVVFDLEIVAAIFLGEKSAGGYDVTILRAEQSGDELLIEYQEKTPAPGSINILVFQQPFHIVRINREVGPKVTFRRTP